MKKFRLLFAIAGIGALSLTSCSKDCQTCTNCGSGMADFEVCEDDAIYGGSNLAYKAAIAGWEANGCDCD